MRPVLAEVDGGTGVVDLWRRTPGKRTTGGLSRRGRAANQMLQGLGHEHPGDVACSLHPPDPLLRTYHWTVLAALTLQACASSLDLPPVAASPPAPAVGVPEAPPVAIPETISEPPDAPGDWVWIDGSWHYGLGRWVWTRGGWVNLPPGAAYFYGGVAYATDGRILYWEPGWVDSDGRMMEAPPIEKPALTPKAERSVKGLL